MVAAMPSPTVSLIDCTSGGSGAERRLVQFDYSELCTAARRSARGVPPVSSTTSFTSTTSTQQS